MNTEARLIMMFFFALLGFYLNGCEEKEQKMDWTSVRVTENNICDQYFQEDKVHNYCTVSVRNSAHGQTVINCDMIRVCQEEHKAK